MAISWLKQQIRQYERDILVGILDLTPNRRMAAEVLGISVRTLFYKINQYEIQREEASEYLAQANTIEKSLLIGTK